MLQYADREAVLQAEANVRRKWKDTGDPVWAYAEAALAWVRGSTNIVPEIVAVLDAEHIDGYVSELNSEKDQIV